MEKVLYINCCIRRENSRSDMMAKHFIGELEKAEKYEITELCLMDEGLQYMSEGFFQQRDRLLVEQDYDHPRFRYAHEFAQADKIVIAAPFWDLSIPALLKVYIENICVDNITFGCNESGMFGLCKADRMVFLTARGSIYKDSPLEMGSRYMEAMAVFFGIEKYNCIAAEGLDLGIRPVEEILQESYDEMDELVKEF